AARAGRSTAGHQQGARPTAPEAVRQLQDFAVTEIAENISSRESRDRRAMVYITADYDLALAVIVFCDRHCQTAHVATAWRIKAVRPLHDVPAKVFAFLHQIDFLKLVLPYIRDEKAPGAAVKRK